MAARERCLRMHQRSVSQRVAVNTLGADERSHSGKTVMQRVSFRESRPLCLPPHHWILAC